ncbi:SpoVG family protein [Candidatus Marinimicrobia bacterium]|nr:SpoVG family protein [Candidatus Neomarinimicrobiota bacterium]
MKIDRMNKGSWGKIRAFFDLRTEEGFTMKGFKLVEGINGLFVGFPSQKGSDDEYRDTIWAERELKDQVTQMAVKVYGQDIMTPAPGTQAPSLTAESNMNGEFTPPMPTNEDVSTVEPFSDEDIPF